MERKGIYGNRRYTGGNRDRHYDPIDLDLMEHGRPLQSDKPRPKNGFKGNKEKEKRRRENLYYNYRKSGHQVKECDSKP